MLNSTLIEIIRSFDRDEFKKFENFVESPYFNKKSNITKLFKAIKKYTPKFSNEKLRREFIWNNLFPDKKFNYGVMKNLIYDLTRLCEKFITIEHYEKNELQKNYDLLDALKERNIPKVFSSKFESVKKIFNETEIKKEDFIIEEYYYLLAKLYLVKFNFNIEFSPKSSIDEELSLSSESLINSFLIYSFKMYNNVLAGNLDYNYLKENNLTEIFLKAISSQSLIEQILAFENRKSDKNYKMLNCFYEMYKSLSDNDSVDKYYCFKKTLEENSNIFSSMDLRDLYVCLFTSLTNLDSSKVNKSYEYLDIHNLMIKNNVFLNPSGLLSESVFNAYVQTACNLGKFEYIENFTKEYLNKLPEDLRENMHSNAMAHFHFAKKEFNKSLEYISKIQHDFFTIKYYLKNLQMMCYYELNDYYSFTFAFDTYKRFISKNKSVNEYWKKSLTNFCNYVNQLFKLRENFDYLEFQKLKKEIFESNPNKKSWLLNKIGELKINLKSNYVK